jgi:hypothetical protein
LHTFCTTNHSRRFDSFSFKPRMSAYVRRGVQSHGNDNGVDCTPRVLRACCWTSGGSHCSQCMSGCPQTCYWSRVRITREEAYRVHYGYGLEKAPANSANSSFEQCKELLRTVQGAPANIANSSFPTLFMHAFLE